MTAVPRHTDGTIDTSALRATAHLDGCTNPIQMVGRSVYRDLVTGNVERHDEQRVYVPCKNRLASVCEPCSRRYQGDAFQIVLTGLVGGKGVPPTVAERPALFVTLTAPSFGTVHRSGGRCRPRRDVPVCTHGTALVCWTHHDEADERGRNAAVRCLLRLRRSRPVERQ